MVKFTDTVIICLFLLRQGLCWECVSDTCYNRSTSKMDWVEGVSYCGYIGGTIASIHSSAENTFIMSSVCKRDRCWIGLNDKYDYRRFRWADGTPLDYQNWYPSEPNDYLGRGERYVEMKSDGTWNDEDPMSIFVICKKPRPTPSPTKADYCIEKVKLHFVSIVLAGCVAICALGIFILRRSTGKVLSPKIFSTKMFSPKRRSIERIGVQSKPGEIPIISMEDLAIIERVQVRELEGIPDCEMEGIDMTPN